MAIVKMTEFNLIVFENKKKELLDSFQKFKEVDFRLSDIKKYGYGNFKSENLEDIDEKIFKLDNAIKNVKRYEVSKGAIKSLKEGNKTFTYDELEKYVSNSNAMHLESEIVIETNKIDSMNKQIEDYQNKIKEYEDFIELDISKNDILKLRKSNFILGTIATKNFENLESELDKKENLVHYEILKRTNKEIIISLLILKNDYEKIDAILRNSGFNNISIELEKTPKEYLKEYDEKIRNCKGEIRKAESKLKEFTSEIETLKISYEYYKNQKLRESVSEKFGTIQNLSVIAGFIPEDKKETFSEKIEKIAEDYYYLEFKEVEKDDRNIPIKFKNNKFNEAFEDLVKTYSIPSYDEVDPTPVVAPFYWLFFGMMVADFGYGLIMLILSTLVLKTCNLSKSTRRMVKFLFYLSFSIMIWGVVYGSYFNLPINVYRLLDPVTEYNKIMILSVLFGVVHLFLGLGVKAYVLIRDGKVLDAILDVGVLYVVLSSAMAYIALSSEIAKYILYASLLVMLFTAGRKLKGVGGKFGLGVYTVYGLTGYLGDLVSYLRLMALGLSGGFIAQSVNMICSMIGYKYSTIIFVSLVFVIGQTINLLLSLLGAYVHTARLIYVEFFSKFYEGGGKEFKDFVIEEKYINIKEN
ncbi:V-type ATP synthase subunit I [Oceanivirga salmonicida]|uniref:V-type ATP synthase subunit I n=1 Tax=Oceanivirga salmonicida TaxID=1769291 RepID=UPI00082FAEA8|nr:V-type ATP synthase subunit I [Oceanivirga salmonicida]